MATITTPPLAPAPADPSRDGVGEWRAGWRVALRLARRDVRRHVGRSLLIVLMVAVPVLLLPAGHLVGVAVGELVQAQLVQGPDGGAMGLAHPTAVELEREADVLGGGERRDEVEVLEDHTDPAAAQGG
jgi:hypothetical protein